jgi:hypothetical protein
MPTHASTKLFKSNRKRIACAVAHQIQQTVPRYQQVDSLTLARNVDSVLQGVQRVLEGGQEQAVTGVLDWLQAQRKNEGFSAGDFLVAVLCSLPVIRRFYANHASSLEAGLRYFEEVEAILIPLYGHWVAADADTFEEAATEPDARSPLAAVADAPRASAGNLLSFNIVSIDDKAVDELARPMVAAEG